MKLLLKNILTFTTLIVSFTSFASNPPNPGIPPAPGAPMDKNIWIMFMVAIIFGIYKLVRYNKEKSLM